MDFRASALKLPASFLRREFYDTACFRHKERKHPMKRSLRVFSVSTLLFFFVCLVVGQETKEVQKSGSFSQNGRLYVDTYKGTVDILPWDKSEINVNATVEADGNGRESRAQVQDTEIRIDLSSNIAHVKTDYDHVTRRHRGFLGLFGVNTDHLPFVHYTIKVPRTTAVVIKDYKSRTTIDGLQADADVDTYKGEIKIERLSGSLDLQTYQGRGRDCVRRSRGAIPNRNVQREHRNLSASGKGIRC